MKITPIRRKQYRAFAISAEAKAAVRNWIPEDSIYGLGMIAVVDTNFYPAEKYVRFVKAGGDPSYHYWLARLRRGEPLTPVIVEPAKLYPEIETGRELGYSVEGWFVRDGIHRLAAAEKAGRTRVPAFIIDTPSDDLVRTFRTATHAEIDRLFADYVLDRKEAKE